MGNIEDLSVILSTMKICQKIKINKSKGQLKRGMNIRMKCVKRMWEWMGKT